MNYRQMAWLSSSESSNKVLHLRDYSGSWKPYTAFPKLCQPDLKLKGASKGYPTMQYLLGAGWTLVPSEEAATMGVLELTR